MASTGRRSPRPSGKCGTATGTCSRWGPAPTEPCGERGGGGSRGAGAARGMLPGPALWRVAPCQLFPVVVRTGAGPARCRRPRGCRGAAPLFTWPPRAGLFAGGSRPGRLPCLERVEPGALPQPCPGALPAAAEPGPRHPGAAASLKPGVF